MKRLFMALAVAFTFVASIQSVGLGRSFETPVRFAVIGDRTGSHVPGVYGQVVREIERMRPDFVMTVGDMIEGYFDDTARIVREWEEYDSIVAPISSVIYYTPGNHDIWSDLSEELYRRHAGAPHCSFDHKGIHFVIIDVSRAESSDDIPADQLDWLARDLEHNQDSPYTFVFYHKPFWEKSTARGKPDTLHSLFVTYGVDAVFSGHYHDYFSGEFDGVLYTCIGSSGGAMTPSPTGLGYHFAWVTVDDHGIHIAPIKAESVLPWDEITISDYNVFNHIRMRGLFFPEPVPVAEDPGISTVEVAVVVSNVRSDFELDDTLHWNVPEAWIVEPPSVPVKVAPHSEKTVRFRVGCTGNIYPTPSASVDFTYAEGKNVTSSAELRLAREVRCNRVDTKIDLDGNISEGFWQDPATRFFHYDGAEARTDPVRFYFAHDDDNLYIAAHCGESRIDSLYAEVTEHDGAVWGEDCVGFFFEPVYGSGTAYQIYVNPLGTVFDQKLTMNDDGYMSADLAWNGEYEIKTIIGDDYWSLEARIPVDQLAATIGKDEKWRLNFRRKQRRLGNNADWQIPIEYNPDTFGILRIR